MGRDVAVVMHLVGRGSYSEHGVVELGDPLDLRWPVPDGTYLVSAETVDRGADEGSALPAEPWRIRVVRA